MVYGHEWCRDDYRRRPDDGLFQKNVVASAVILGMSVSVMAFAVFGMTHLLWVALLMQFMSGLVMPAIQIGINTMILGNTEESFVGRVNGILNPLFMGAMVITMSLAGSIKASFSLETIYLTCAALFLVGVFIMVPSLKYKQSVISQPSSE